MKGRFNLRQGAALTTAVILTVVFFSSSFFVFTHLSHECTGSHCRVCQELEVCISAISVISEAIGTAAAVFIACQITNYRIIPYIAGLFLRPFSLVELKVRMDN